MRKPSFKAMLILSLMASTPAQADSQADARYISEQSFSPAILQGIMDTTGPMISAAIQQQLSARDIVLSDPDAFLQLLAEEFQGFFLAEMRRQNTIILQEMFTDQELSDIAAFFATPSGQTYLQRTPELMQRGSEIGEQVGGIAFQLAGARIAQRMEDEGITFSVDKSMSQRLMDMLRP